MNLANPRAIGYLVFTLLLSGGAWFYARKLQSRLALWITEPFWKSVIPDFSKAVFFRRNLFLSLGLVFLSIALLRPQWGQHEEMIETKGLDILFLLDLSNSMLVEDTPPSRLSRARTFIRKTLAGLGTDRAGVISFAGKAFLTVPLTNDFDYVADMVDTFAPDTLASQGTNIGAAIDVAIHAFERGGEDPHKQSRAVILITDGEDFGETANKAAAKLKDFGAGFIALSVGTTEGGPIPLRSQNGVLQTYKKDSSQKPVLSRVNRELLAKIASTGGGSHIELINPEDAAYAVVKALRNLSRDDLKSRTEVVKIDRFQIFVALAILFFMAHLSTGYRRFRLGGLSFLVLFMMLPQNSRAVNLDTYLESRKAEKQYRARKFEESAIVYEEAKKDSDENPVLSFNQGTALARAKKNPEAISQLQAATKGALARGDFETAAKSLYNEGILHSEQKNMKDSFDRLTKAIELAKRSDQKELEENARKALSQAYQQQQREGRKQDKQGDKKDSDDPKNPGPSGSEPKPQGSKPEEEGRKRQYKGATVSKDVAESLMNDLSDREKQLYQRRLGEKKPKEAPNEKDW
jgi:Ca-activated chloride channel family protein